MKYLARLKSEKRAVEGLSKLPKAPFDSKDSNETSCFHKNKPAPLRSNDQVPVSSCPEWQLGFCVAHADSNGWRGCCPVNLENCLLSRIINSDGNLDLLRGIDLAHGVTTDQIVDEWLDAGEPASDLVANPLWFVVLAELRLAA